MPSKIKILVVNKLLKWILDAFLNVNCLYAENQDEILEFLNKFLPNIFIFGDYNNSFSSIEGKEINEIIRKNGINLFIYGGWGGFEAGGYSGSFLESLLDLSFKEEQLEQILIKIKKTDDSFLPVDFSICPSIACYHRITIPQNKYHIELYWGNKAKDNPLLISREVNSTRQIVFLSSILPGGAKRLIMWPYYVYFLKACLEWLINSKIRKADFNSRGKEAFLKELLRRYWRNSLTDDFLIEAITKKIPRYEKEKFLLIRNASEFIENWGIAAIVAKKLIDYEIDKSLKTINMRKAEYHKLIAYKYLDSNSFNKASLEFKKSANLWKEVYKYNVYDPNAVGFYLYFQGLYYFFRSLYIINLREGNPEEAKRIINSANKCFRQSKEVRGHGLKDIFMELCNLFDLVIRYVNANQNTLKSYLECFYILRNFQNIKTRINSSSQKLLKHYKQFIEQERLSFGLTMLPLYFDKIELYYKEGFLDKEHFSAFTYIKELLSKRLIIKIIIKILSALLLPIPTIVFAILSFIFPAYFIIPLTIFIILIAISVIISSKI